MANIYQTPSTVTFSLPYSDGSGERIVVVYSAKDEDVEIDSDKRISINKNDLEWLIEVLQDVQRLHKEAINPKA